MTDIDTAHAAMEAAPDDDAARLRFYERLADSEIYLLLGEEAEGDQITPALFDVEGVQYALIFDREERLSDFVGRAAPYAALPGRALVQMLAGQSVGLGLNLEVAPSGMLIPPDAVDWLAQTLSHAPSETEARLTAIAAPRQLPQSVVTGLDRKLAIAAGLAQTAYLVAATYDSGAQGHVLAFVDAVSGAEKALASATGEALTFSGIEAGVMDVLFLQASDPMAARLARVGLRFDLPVPDRHTPQAPSAPGMDPSKPPKLR
ncbi:MAG: SseB family protein [Loktanella sp.]|nr:SseB family protein [Loktanella sp.]